MVLGLLRLINVDTIDQENICGLNTAIVQCMIAARQNSLPTLLDVSQKFSPAFLLSFLLACLLFFFFFFFFFFFLSPLSFEMFMLPQNLRQQEEGSVALHTFFSLLKFWRSHYRGRGRECHSLEHSSRIHFSDWRLTVSALIKTLEAEGVVV